MTRRIAALTAVLASLIVFGAARPAEAIVGDGWWSVQPSVAGRSCGPNSTINGVRIHVCVGRNGAEPLTYLLVKNTAAGSRVVMASGRVDLDGNKVDGGNCAWKTIAAGADFYCVFGQTPSYRHVHTVEGAFTLTTDTHASLTRIKSASVDFG